jgi:glycosyltransferase 2 family protein
LTTPTAPRRAPIWQALIGIVISALLLWWSLKNVDFPQLITNIRTARPGPILLGVALATLTFVIRIFRWRLLLRAEDGAALRTLPLWHAIAMGFMANNILPLRMGEVVRTYAAHQLTGVRFTAALASIAVERLFDAITVILLLGVGLVVAELPAGSTVAGIPIGRLVSLVGLGAIAGFVAAGLVVAFPLAAERAARRLIPGERLAGKVVGLIEGLRQGLSVLSSPARMAGVALWSFGVWGVCALSFHAMFGAFDIRVTFAGALLMQGLIMFGIAVPSTPGYVGVFEAPIIAVLSLYGVDPTRAAAYAFTYHVTTFLPITLLGAWSVFRTNFGLRALRKGEGGVGGSGT